MHENLIHFLLLSYFSYLLEEAMESVSAVDIVSKDFNNSDLVVPSRYD